MWTPPPKKNPQKNKRSNKKIKTGASKVRPQLFGQSVGPRGAGGRSLRRVLEGETTTKKGEKKTEEREESAPEQTAAE